MSTLADRLGGNTTMKTFARNLCIVTAILLLALAAPDLRARDAAVELRRYCSERAKKMFYRKTPLPRWTSRLRLGRREHTVAGQLNPVSPRST